MARARVRERDPHKEYGRSESSVSAHCACARLSKGTGEPAVLNRGVRPQWLRTELRRAREQELRRSLGIAAFRILLAALNSLRIRPQAEAAR